MYELYIHSSFGWKPEEKKKELFDTLSRFILLSSGQTEEVAGFCMFRFEYENGDDILYCYELQISRSHKRRSLGRYMIDSLSAIGAALKMDKIMLTVLLANSEARGFYKAMGFTLDPTSPGVDGEADEEEGNESDTEEEEEQDADYEILSKSC
ncbi:hypothetical protein K435DRAFT_146510 [Dendrothele bispora CBS 962.96]|uniref:N-alpha-acetyltransferase 40 n=1 Tax=Dendrothele bispora (strain CBS 962.96) TaxID=1314807 RepID=A0A4S8MPG1_DENBC|nr:hypothetical protein K435DRAFT_146510 [Dendrothele bispora CBS 962.96]